MDHVTWGTVGHDRAYCAGLTSVDAVATAYSGYRVAGGYLSYCWDFSVIDFFFAELFETPSWIRPAI